MSGLEKSVCRRVRSQGEGNKSKADGKFMEQFESVRLTEWKIQCKDSETMEKAVEHTKRDGLFNY